DTVLQSRSKTVVIGPEQPFCVIGERINPTGRRTSQAKCQAADLSRIEVDVAEQIAGGADMLDVNVGDPLADEVGLMGQAIPLVQSLTDVPLCIDSSVIEALEAGLSVYEGKALVNSVTGEDDRLDEILPLVAKHAPVAREPCRSWQSTAPRWSAGPTTRPASPRPRNSGSTSPARSSPPPATTG